MTEQTDTALTDILEASPVGIAILDRATGQRLFVNSALVEIIGATTHEELISGDISDTWVNPEDLDRAWKALQHDDNVVNFEAERLRQDGSRWWVLMNSQQAVFKGRDAGIIWHIDITKRKIAETELQDAYSTISSSINYAARIQRSILPVQAALNDFTRDHFIIWEPRDQVGGDIYWCRPWGLGFLVICADCTGHGVPGAFMTLISSAALDRAQETVVPGRAGQLISRIHQLVQINLKQNLKEGESDDGLELGVCYVNKEESQMTFAGARFSLFTSDANGITETKGDRSGVGYRSVSLSQQFIDHSIALTPGAHYYMATDGLIDQVGGKRRRMFGKKRFSNLLWEIRDQSMIEQKESICNALLDYQGSENRRDDVSMIGFKVC